MYQKREEFELSEVNRMGGRVGAGACPRGSGRPGSARPGPARPGPAGGSVVGGQQRLEGAFDPGQRPGAGGPALRAVDLGTPRAGLARAGLAAGGLLDPAVAGAKSAHARGVGVAANAADLRPLPAVRLLPQLGPGIKAVLL